MSVQVQPGSALAQPPRAALLFKERLAGRFGARLETVKLYGSYARGDQHEESDMDVLALVRGLTHDEKVEAIGIGTEVSLETGAWLAPLVMDPVAFDKLRQLEARLALDIDREGIAL